MKHLLRQGDVLLVPVPVASVKGACVGKDSRVLAYGEVTGHKHVLHGRGAQFFQEQETVFAVVGKEGAELAHDTHELVKVPKGVYEVRLQREFDLVNGVRQVMD